jgi:hypothetical protein
MAAVSELGAVIAQMRAQVPPVPYRQIAAQLGISVGKVQRELARASFEGQAGALPPAPPVLNFDPEVTDSRRRLEMGRLELAQQRLALDRLELEQRMNLIQSAQAGKGDNGPMLALLLGEIGRLREHVAGGGAATGRGGLIDTLQEFRDVGEIVKAMAPPPAVSGRDGVEMTIALERIRQENERIFREREAELGMKRLEIEGQAARDHALAKLIEGLGPVAAQAAQTWVERQNSASRPAPAMAALPAAAADPASSGRGHCPRCSYPPGDQEMELVASGGEDKCPGCSALLAVVDGKIALAAAASRSTSAPAAGAVANSNGNGHGPALPTYTS